MSELLGKNNLWLRRLIAIGYQKCNFKMKISLKISLI